MLGWIISIGNALFGFFYAIYNLLNNIPSVLAGIASFWDFATDTATIYLGNFPAPILMIAYIFLNVVLFKIIIEVI